LNSYIGEIAALSVSIAWAGTSTLFTLAGRNVGSVVTNRVRLIFAVLFLSLTHWVVHAEPIPLNVEPTRLFWLSLSGIIGLVVGDAMLLQALVWVGPRISMLLMSLSPIFAGLASWVMLGEPLSAFQLLAIAVTIGGVVWVIWERGAHETQNSQHRSYSRGILYGLGGALGQALGLVISKLGLYGEFSALSGTLVRMVTAALFMWALALIQGQAKATVKRLQHHRRALLLIVGGAFFGPFIGVWLSLIAVQRANVGVASTLMSLSPIVLLPISYFVFKERMTSSKVLGTIIALSGVAMLFLA
jgi:drug/metabolite transporter (DMT)-like permease